MLNFRWKTLGCELQLSGEALAIQVWKPTRWNYATHSVFCQLHVDANVACCRQSGHRFSTTISGLFNLIWTKLLENCDCIRQSVGESWSCLQYQSPQCIGIALLHRLEASFGSLYARFSAALFGFCVDVIVVFSVFGRLIVVFLQGYPPDFLRHCCLNIVSVKIDILVSCCVDLKNTDRC